MEAGGHRLRRRKHRKSSLVALVRHGKEKANAESKTIVIISVSQQLDAKHDVEGITGLIRGLFHLQS